MRAPRIAPIAAGTASIALASLLIASPASAAVLPDGQRITVIEQGFVEVGPTPNTYYEVNPASAVGTQVGAPSGAIVTSMDVNQDGQGYGTGLVSQGVGLGVAPYLYPVDAKTGVTGPGVEIIPVDDDVQITDCLGIDYQPDGTIVLACINAPDGVLDSYLGTVTPDGAFTVFFNSMEQEEDVFVFTALATSSTGQLWAFEYDSYWAVDRTANPWTLSSVAATDGRPVFGADFDRNDQLFITTSSDGPYELGTLDLVSGEVTVAGAFADGETLDQVEAITVWGRPALPATGAADLVPIGIGTALLFLAGAAFIATSRIQRRPA